MSLAIFLFVCLPTIIAVVVAALRWRGSESWKKGLNVPPGSMGWPLLGETIGFMKSHPCTTIGDYLEERTRK